MSFRRSSVLEVNTSKISVTALNHVVMPTAKRKSQISHKRNLGDQAEEVKKRWLALVTKNSLLIIYKNTLLISLMKH